MSQQVCEIVYVRRMVADLAGKDRPGCGTNDEAEPSNTVVEQIKVGLPDIVVQSQLSQSRFDKRHSLSRSARAVAGNSSASDSLPRSRRSL